MVLYVSSGFRRRRNETLPEILILYFEKNQPEIRAGFLELNLLKTSSAVIAFALQKAAKLLLKKGITHIQVCAAGAYYAKYYHGFTTRFGVRPSAASFRSSSIIW